MQAQQPLTRFERSNGTETSTYEEALAFLRQLDTRFSQMKVRQVGETDAGEPLHLVVMSTDGDSDLPRLHKKGKTVLLINNAIHPGEPDGVDASLMMIRDMLTRRNGWALPEQLAVCVIPFYNVGGTLNRNSTSRANQNGPKEYGFRGNARHYDLNRDFIKADTKNARTFAELFHWIDPDLFVDTHVSNGADYQHVMTLISTQSDKLGGPLGEYLREVIEPYLYEQMKERGFPMTPYVTTHGPNIQKEGLTAFNDLPRYSTGYASLFQTPGFMPESHMLKPYDQRVQAMSELLRIFVNFAAENGPALKELRAEARRQVSQQPEFTLSWQQDTLRSQPMRFMGYEHLYKTSDITGQYRLIYDRKHPYEANIAFYNRFLPEKTVARPEGYVIPQAWWTVIQRLKENGVQMTPLRADTALEVEAYRIESLSTVNAPFEGHYLHTDVVVESSRRQVHFRKGDMVVLCNQPQNRYIIETLEPTAPDSFFAWNYFDSILQAKEGYSDYVFEDTAEALLQNDPELKKAFQEKKRREPIFARSSKAQLDYLYLHSPNAEPERMQYPIYRMLPKP